MSVYPPPQNYPAIFNPADFLYTDETVTYGDLTGTFAKLAGGETFVAAETFTGGIKTDSITGNLSVISGTTTTTVGTLNVVSVIGYTNLYIFDTTLSPTPSTNIYASNLNGFGLITKTVTDPDAATELQTYAALKCTTAGTYTITFTCTAKDPDDVSNFIILQITSNDNFISGGQTTLLYEQIFGTEDNVVITHTYTTTLSVGNCVLLGRGIDVTSGSDSSRWGFTDGVLTITSSSAKTVLSTTSSGVAVTGNLSVTGNLLAAKSGAGTNALALGSGAGQSSQGNFGVAVGLNAGYTAQGSGGVAVGATAGYSSQGSNSIAIGNTAGQSSQGGESVAIGHWAGRTTQGTNAVAIGYTAGQTSQGNYGVAVGFESGSSTQAYGAVGIGLTAGKTSQGDSGVAIGNAAGFTGQGTFAVAVGGSAGKTSQSAYAVGIGLQAGETSQGGYSIAIGAQAGQSNQHTNSIILNASGSALNSDGSTRFYVNPIRNAANSNLLSYNATTKEVTYSQTVTPTTISVGGGPSILGKTWGSSATSHTITSTDLSFLASTTSYWQGKLCVYANDGAGAVGIFEVYVTKLAAGATPVINATPILKIAGTFTTFTLTAAATSITVALSSAAKISWSFTGIQYG